MLQQLPSLPPPTLPHVMVTISTTFESPKAENCSHITEPAVKFSLLHHKLFQMASNFLEKSQTTKKSVQGENKDHQSIYFTSDKPNIPITSIINLHPPKGGSAHAERPPTNTK